VSGAGAGGAGGGTGAGGAGAGGTGAVVVDASVAVKWVVAEPGSEAALALRRRHGPAGLLAPELLAVECANILWRKARLGELSAREARVAGAVLARAGVALLPVRLPAALDLALRLGHPAYDCAYLALALERGLPFATADARLLRRLAEARAAGMEVPEGLAVA
jgi:predicted nucleic acid-binding protein